jgi:hypothetical protein
MHLQLIDEAHALVDVDNVDWNSSKEEKDGEWDYARNMDIWNDGQTMLVMNGG